MTNKCRMLPYSTVSTNCPSSYSVMIKFISQIVEIFISNTITSMSKRNSQLDNSFS